MASPEGAIPSPTYDTFAGVDFRQHSVPWQKGDSFLSADGAVSMTIAYASNAYGGASPQDIPSSPSDRLWFKPGAMFTPYEETMYTHFGMAFDKPVSGMQWNLNDFTGYDFEIQVVGGRVDVALSDLDLPDGPGRTKYGSLLTMTGSGTDHVAIDFAPDHTWNGSYGEFSPSIDGAFTFTGDVRQIIWTFHAFGHGAGSNTDPGTDTVHASIDSGEFFMNLDPAFPAEESASGMFLVIPEPRPAVLLLAFAGALCGRRRSVPLASSQ